MNETFQRLTRVISDELLVPEEDILPGTVLGKDIPCDSLDYTLLILKVESEFGIDIDPDDVKLAEESVGRLSELIQSKL